MIADVIAELQGDESIFLKNDSAWCKRYGDSLEMFAPKVESELVDSYSDFLDNSKKMADMMGTVPDSIRYLICAGIGEGTGVRRLLENAVNVKDVLIYEPEISVFLYTCTRYDLSDIISDGRIDIVFGDGKNIKEAIKDSVLKHSELFNLYHMYSQIIPPYQYRYPGLLENVIKSVKENLLEFSTSNNILLKSSREIFNNQLCSFSLIPFSYTVDQLFECIPDKDTPIVLVGAGPSLKKNVRKLKKIEGRACIIACSRSLSVLAQNDIKVDLLAVIDYEQGHDYSECDINREYKVLFHAQAAADIQKKYIGRGIYYGYDGQVIRIPGIDKLYGSIPTGGSVMTSIFSLFVNAGYTNFILVGEDLAYSDDGRSHSAGMQDEAGNELFYAEGISGGRVAVRHDWKIMLDFFANMIKLNPQIRVVDSTEGGARIPGTEIVDLSLMADQIKENGVTTPEHINDLATGQLSTAECMSTVMHEKEERFRKLQMAISDAIICNERIVQMIRMNELEGESASEVIRKYEALYSELVEGEEWEDFKRYCMNEFHEYADQMKYLDGKDKVVMLDAENALFKKMRIACSELCGRIRQLEMEMKQWGGDNKNAM